MSPEGHSGKYTINTSRYSRTCMTDKTSTSIKTKILLCYKAPTTVVTTAMTHCLTRALIGERVLIVVAELLEPLQRRLVVGLNRLS